jgi:hypothetical protein
VSYPHIYKRSFGVLSQVVFYQTELLRWLYQLVSTIKMKRCTM